MTKLTPMEILNKVKEKAKLNNEDFSKSVAIRLKPGKIKFQLIAKDDEHLFRPRTQHMIPTIPNEDDKNEKWLIADCKGELCPICTAATAFKNSGIELDTVNEAYNPKYPYRSLRSIFTQSEHYLLFAKILADQADDGNYLPKDSEIGSTHLIQFPKTALNGLMSAYEDLLEDAEENIDEMPSLFAIFNGEDKAKSLTITARVTNQPYSCNFSFGKVAEVNINDVDTEKMDLLENPKVVPEEHYDKCVKRIKNIQNYFVGAENKDREQPVIETKITNELSADIVDDDDDLNLDDIL